MHLDWILHPLTQYIFLAAGLSLCLVLYLNCQRQISAARARIGTQNAAYDEAIDKLQTELTEMRERLQETEEHARNALPPGTLSQGINLTKRSQILRMHKRGERPEQIAAALCLPSSEVDLLLKFHLATVEGLG